MKLYSHLPVMITVASKVKVPSLPLRDSLLSQFGSTGLASLTKEWASYYLTYAEPKNVLPEAMPHRKKVCYNAASL